MDAPTLAWLIEQWVRCEPHLARAVDRNGGTFDLDHVWGEIMNNRAQFWPGTNMAIVTRIETHPSGIVSCLFWLCGGKDLDEIRAAEQRITEWAKGRGCTQAEIIGRRGWLKTLDGYREASTIMTRDL